MFKTFRSFLGFSLLGIMLATAAVPTVALAQGKGKKSSKKGGKGSKGAAKKGGGKVGK